MDDHSNRTMDQPYSQPAGVASAPRTKLSEKAEEVKAQIADLGRKAVDNLEESRHGAAAALGQAAAKLHSSGEQLASAAHTAAGQISGVAPKIADKLEAAGNYIRATDLKAMGEDVKDIVKRYPGPALAAAAVLGFIVARSLRRD